MGKLPDDKDIRLEEQLLNEPMHQDARPGLLDLISRLRCAAGLADLFHLHRDLLIEFGAHQQAVDDTLPAARDRARSEIAELARLDPKPIEELKRTQQTLKRVERQARVAKALQHSLREIGDGIAWRALRDERRSFSILGDGTRVGRLAQGVGLDAEIGVLSDLWEQEQTFAVHNDLTNCLRIGDLTAVRETDDTLDVTLIEVKASEGASAAAQVRRMDEATEFLRAGRGVRDGKTADLTTVPSRYACYFAQVEALIAQARETGYAWNRVHDCLLVGAVDYRVFGQDVEENTRRSERARAEIGWPDGEPDTLGWTTSMRRMRDRRNSISSFAPTTIYPLPAEDVVDLVMGPIDIAVSLHLEGLERVLTQRGLEVRVARPPESKTTFLEASRRGAGVTMPPSWREQMMNELVAPDCIVDALDHVVTLNETAFEAAGDSRIVVFEDESAVWESRR